MRWQNMQHTSPSHDSPSRSQIPSHNQIRSHSQSPSRRRSEEDVSRGT